MSNLAFIPVRNVNDALPSGLRFLSEYGIVDESRNGSVTVAPAPVITTYAKPEERVLFSPARDANPFFHLMESLWMLGGRNDVKFVEQFVPRMKEYSDDGHVLHGAYGYRWRKAFGFDQLQVIIDELKSNPKSRRCVLAMWDATRADGDIDEVCGMDDLHKAMNGGKDVPCNTHAYFQVQDGRLNMTVCNRSNDVVWGTYGANAVHFSILQEYVASMVGVGMGTYVQFSNNYHLYSWTPNLEAMQAEEASRDLYANGTVIAMRLVNTPQEVWDKELEIFLTTTSEDDTVYNEPFFALTACPMRDSFTAYRANDMVGAMHAANKIVAPDWRFGCLEWLQRRKLYKEAVEKGYLVLAVNN